MGDRNVGPPIPRRNSYLFREVVDAEDGAALVTSGNNQSDLNSWHRPRYNLNQKRFPLARNRGYIDLSLADQPVNYSVLSNCTHDNRVTPEIGRGIGNTRRAASDPRHVRLKISRCTRHTPVIIRVYIDARERLPVRNGKAATVGNVLHVTGLANRKTIWSQKGEKQGKQNHPAERP